MFKWCESIFEIEGPAEYEVDIDFDQIINQKLKEKLTINAWMISQFSVC